MFLDNNIIVALEVRLYGCKYKIGLKVQTQLYSNLSHNTYKVPTDLIGNLSQYHKLYQCCMLLFLSCFTMFTYVIFVNVCYKNGFWVIVWQNE